MKRVILIQFKVVPSMFSIVNVLYHLLDGLFLFSHNIYISLGKSKAILVMVAPSVS